MKRIVLIAIVVATLLLAISFALAGAWIVAPIWVLAGALWLLGELRSSPSAPTLGLLACVVGTFYGSFEGVPLVGLLVALVAALVAWDGGSMLRRVRIAPQVEFAAELEQAHQRRLVYVAGGGLLFGLLALLMRLPLTFGWALVLGVIAIIGLASVLRFLQRESD